jgi:hypothetical protein
MSLPWRTIWKARGTSASLGLKLLAVVMMLYILLDQVTGASSTYLAFQQFEHETGKENSSRVTRVEEILPHSHLRLGVDARRCIRSLPFRPPVTLGNLDAFSSAAPTLQVISLTSRLRC